MDKSEVIKKRGVAGAGTAFYGARLGGEGGFSLLELIIAISILAIGLVAAATTLSTGIGTNRMAQRLTVETNLAYSVLDEFLSKDAGDVLFDNSAVGVVYDLDTGNAVSTRVVNGVTYSALYSITSNSPVAGVAQVSVTVSGGGRSVTLTTIKRSI